MKIPRIANEFDYWDMLISDSIAQNLAVEDQSVKSLGAHNAKALWVRGVYKGSWVMVSSQNTKNLQDAFREALKLGRVRGANVHIKKQRVKDSVTVTPEKNPFGEDLEKQLKRVLLLSKTTKGVDKRVRRVFATLASVKSKNEFYDSEGSMLFETDYKTMYSVSALAREGDVMQRAHKGDARTGGLEVFYDKGIVGLAQDTVAMALRLLHAKHAPAKTLPLVCDGALSGVFFHEAVGHACEADAILEGASVMKGMMGKAVASPLVSFSDGLVQHSFGSYQYDSEGVKKTTTPLIKDGVLTGYLHSLDTASKMKAEPTGNGRSQSVYHFPIPRMSTSILRPGTFTKDELIRDIKEGVYAAGSSGGQVIPTEGKFVFGAQEAWLIKDGEITTPLRDVSLTGNILKTLQLIDGIGKKSVLSEGGFCGKAGQSVPVGEFAPHMRISKVVVGGRAE
ncbi:hypothetical protein COT72_04135 [archaeon CG10_big_fil_rev_8_21_14_0_10_43_11]|nr:MAG: hypothetical protein COT72_04135 [archaeon CG10_big_fil_rev_8_21_14_0_10_43_11]